MARHAHTLDTVELLEEWAGWPVGTIASVVAKHPETALVEIVTDADVDEHGLPSRELLDDMITVPYTALRVVESARAHTR